ncbi:ASN_HP2_G0020760.mRNA.1.CDS.1 [Saccharomyces cerevisiae]|nr:BGN_3a_G0021320.mRNA.1.CDS.1 [Saccharomyces cerevisiae]CAI5274812.1 ASN_HP2_G0020760.mRNA.1.CDS.1 [Saccharomyces cerevisiae]CAI6523640.1 ASN_HP2_G0020760.mRNA.1.CDS.1 [Saccharomyces cerevisiae]CAI7129579.1 BGN_3a_G0021320.mRNA.1.CDS.1 [Saccharomyces cerevisiae]
MAKTTKVKGNKKEVKASKQAKEEKAKAVSSSSSDSSSSSSSSSESESESESESSSSSSSSSSDSESSSSSSSDSESEAETKKEESKDSSSSSSSSDSSSDEEEEEEKEETKKEESKESSSSDSSSSSSSDSESEKEESNDKKRKSEDAEEEEDEESSNKKQKNEETEEPATIFVGRLSWSIDDEWLKKEFEHIGGVIGARVIYERGTDRSRGYGYVDFENKSYAEKAIQEMQGKEIDGRPINCDMSTSKPAGNNDRAKKFGDTPSEPSDTLFLGNLSFNADRDAIFELFAKHGEVVSVRIPTHPETEQPKGFGYVQFSNMEDAKKALDALQGEYIDNRPVRLDFSSPRPNNDGGRGGSRGFGGHGGNRGFGGRGGARGGRGGFRPSGSGANTAPLGRSRNTASFAGSKKTFD